MDSWSWNCPFDPLPLPLPFHVDTCAGLEDHVRPPSLRLKSLIPVRMLSGFAGFTAIGVSSWAAVSPPPLLASTTNTAGGRTAAKLGRSAAGERDSEHAVSATAAPTATACMTM